MSFSRKKGKLDNLETQENQPGVRTSNHKTGTDDEREVVLGRESDEGAISDSVTRNEIRPTGVEDEAGAEEGNIGSVIRAGPEEHEVLGVVDDKRAIEVDAGHEGRPETAAGAAVKKGPS